MSRIPAKDYGDLAFMASARHPRRAKASVDYTHDLYIRAGHHESPAHGEGGTKSAKKTNLSENLLQSGKSARSNGVDKESKGERGKSRGNKPAAEAGKKRKAGSEKEQFADENACVNVADPADARAASQDTATTSTEPLPTRAAKKRSDRGGEQLLEGPPLKSVLRIPVVPSPSDRVVQPLGLPRDACLHRCQPVLPSTESSKSGGKQPKEAKLSTSKPETAGPSAKRSQSQDKPPVGRTRGTSGEGSGASGSKPRSKASPVSQQSSQKRDTAKGTEPAVDLSSPKQDTRPVAAARNAPKPAAKPTAKARAGHTQRTLPASATTVGVDAVRPHISRVLHACPVSAIHPVLSVLKP